MKNEGPLQEVIVSDFFDKTNLEKETKRRGSLQKAVVTTERIPNKSFTNKSHLQ